ncbi:MAG: PAS domain S-box protein [Anaerolineae bacterium]|nr:PAS domain S-box protein [Anaerolineae bacterium]
MQQSQEKTSEQLAQELAAARKRIAELETAETQYRQTQAELKEVGERYHNLFEYAGDAIFIIDPNTLQILDVNASAARRFGYNRDELLRLTIEDIEVFDPADPDQASARESSYGGTIVYECYCRHKRGAQIPVEVSSRLVKYGDREVLLNFVRDVTERRQAQKALRESLDRLDVLRQADIELTLRLDVHYVITMALDAAIRLSTAPAGFIGLAGEDAVRVTYAIGPYAANFVGSYLSPDTGIVGRVIRNRRAEFVINVAADPDHVPTIHKTRAMIAIPLVSHRRFIGILCLETHAPECFTPDTFDFLKLLTGRVAIAIDNADMFEERSQLAQELEAFAHTVAHDLKNPLAGVIGFAGVLVENFKNMTDRDIQRFLVEIIRIGEKMNNITDELLLLASVRELDEVPLEPLDMGQIIYEAQSRLYQIIEEYGAEIVMLPQKWPVAWGYAAWIEEVWANYISNAIKYGGSATAPPRVELGATVQGDGMVSFWVRDNGPGIALEEQARLFNRFARLEGARAKGHGLGLSIVQRIVQKLGGEVDVQSAPGKGSVFSFTLPAADGFTLE